MVAQGFAAFLVVFATSCFAAPKIIPLADLPYDPALDVRQVQDYGKMAGSIVGILRNRLKLPIPAFNIEIYSVPAEFEQALIANLKVKPEVARAAAGFAKAAVGNSRVMVNEPALAAWPWPERVVTLAHEITHACQLELAGQRSVVRGQWLTEGFAEWAGYQVAHDLGVQDLPAARASMVARVRVARSGAGLAPLAKLDTFDQWVAERKKRGFDSSYPYAFIVIEFLIERHSYARTLDYFRQRRVSDDPAANFKAVFGESLPQFQAALDVHLHKLLD